MFVQRRRIWKHDNEAEGEMLSSDQSWRSVKVKTQPRLGKLSMNIPTFYAGTEHTLKISTFQISADVPESGSVGETVPLVCNAR